MDPLSNSYPWYTPYQFAGNKPIWAIDVDGAEELIKTYRFENGRATLLNIVHNGDHMLIDKPGKFWKEPGVWDHRTNKPMDPKDIGQVQYVYVDNTGKELEIHKDYDGVRYLLGKSTMMAIGDDNMFQSIYIGGTNPMIYSRKEGKDVADYRREPTDEVDLAALNHDMAYDRKNAGGKKDAFFNRDLIPEDKALIAAANTVIEKSRTGEKDSVTGKSITLDTLHRAKMVSALFTTIITDPAFKGDKPMPK